MHISVQFYTEKLHVAISAKENILHLKNIVKEKMVAESNASPKHLQF